MRGPGGTLGGANAVNGVINIITRPAEETQGSTVWVKGGPEERGFGALQHGGGLGESAFYRIYGKGFRRDAFELESGGRAADSWDMMRGGFRIDGDRSGGNWVLSGEGCDGRMSQTVEDGVSLTPHRRQRRSALRTIVFCSPPLLPGNRCSSRPSWTSPEKKQRPRQSMMALQRSAMAMSSGFPSYERGSTAASEPSSARGPSPHLRSSPSVSSRERMPFSKHSTADRQAVVARPLQPWGR